jgi:hypothetical protein
MKYLFVIFTTLFSWHSFAENTEDLSQMLKDSHCIPVRGKDGNVSTYQCDVITSVNGKAVDSPAKAMELYNSIKGTDTMTVQKTASLTDKIKSCLVGVYTSQISFRKEKGTYTSAGDELGLNKLSMCKGLDVSADYANQSGFKFVAKAGDKIWSVDETKMIEEIR